MNAPVIHRKNLSFSQLSNEGKRNAVGLNFQDFITDGDVYFSENHRKLMEEVKQKQKEWGLEGLKFEISLRKGFKIKPGTLSENFEHTCEQLLKVEKGNKETEKAICELRDAHIWAKQLMENPDMPIKVNYQFKREEHKGIIPYGCGCEESRDILVSNDNRIKAVWQLDSEEKQRWIEALRLVSNVEETRKLIEIQLKSTFEPVETTKELSQLTSEVLRRKANQRSCQFEKFLEQKLKTWENEIKAATETISFRDELTLYLNANPQRYLFDEAGWMRKMY